MFIINFVLSIAQRSRLVWSLSIGLVSLNANINYIVKDNIFLLLTSHSNATKGGQTPLIFGRLQCSNYSEHCTLTFKIVECML